ncbi:MAG TPA: choice-of-anchor tandem repeat GloVer-containing protein [Verrucomicrobiae bacterium]|jgi:uncharacterized repeat protein (TIGR03803 family)|nr:choice-of-anchor tandem repeat GloVer-containing protein [Verrucomicrobiae bacterium]
MFRRIFIAIVAFCSATVTVRAQAFTTLYSFNYSTTGGQPVGNLVLAGSIMYGTAVSGGTNGGGVAYGVNISSSSFIGLHSFSFSGTNGNSPNTGLVLSSNRVFGTASAGGSFNHGTIYGVNTNGAGFSILHEFTGGSGSGEPMGALTLLGDTLYGTTQEGAIYSIKTNGTAFSILHQFPGTDGSAPMSSLTYASGLLFGTTSTGGANSNGTVFAISPDGSGFTDLHDFGPADGATPMTGVVVSGPTLYGTTSAGGASGDGIVFSMETDGSGFQVIHTFTGATHDGADPLGDMALSGNTLYGTTDDGGFDGVGVVFSMQTDGSEYTNLYEFSGNDGAFPQGGLLIANGYVYGSTANGGSGTLFEISAPSTVSVHLANALANGGFESPIIIGNSGQALTPDSWQADGHAPTLENGIPGPNYPAPEEGQQYIGLTVEANGDSDGVTQTFTATNAGLYFLVWTDTAPLGGGTNAPYSVQILNSGSVSILSTNVDAYHGSLAWSARVMTPYLSPGNYTLRARAEGPIGHAPACLDNFVLVPAQTNVVQDGSFESPQVPGNSKTHITKGGSFGSWTLEQTSGGLNVYTNTSSDLPSLYLPTPAGGQFASFVPGGPQTLRQTIASGLFAGRTYALTFLQSGDAVSGHPDRVTASMSYGGTNAIFQKVFTLPDGSGWTPQEFDFILPVTGYYTLRFACGNGDQVNLDNIAVIPTSQFIDLEIFSQPVGFTNLIIDTNATFSVGAQSSYEPILQYQWRLNGADIRDATNSTYTIGDVQVSDSGQYDVLVSDGVSALASIPVELTVTGTFVTSNDFITNATVLPSNPSGARRSENTNATTTAGEPPIYPGNPPRKTIWFKWIPKGTGVATFSTSGSSFDTVLGAFHGSLANPVGIADDDSGGNLTSEISFNVSGAQTYYIGVDGYGGASGDVYLSWTETTTGDLAPVILEAPVDAVVSNSAAAAFGCDADNGTVLWYKTGVRSPVAGGPDFTISQVDDTLVGTYAAIVSSSTGVPTRSQPFQLQINVLEDGSSSPTSEAYHKFLDAASNPFLQPPPLPQVRRSGGGDTRGFTMVQVYSTVGNVSEPGEPAICGQIGGAPEWYAYKAPTNGDVLITTAGSSFNTMLGVFSGTGTTFATLTNLGCGYTVNHTTLGQPAVLVSNVPAGQTLYIVVDGYHGASGVVHLNINLGQRVTAVAPPEDQYAALGGGATFTVIAQGSTPILYQWQFAGTNIARATNATLSLTGVSQAHLGPYTVVASNLVSQTAFTATLGAAGTVAIQTQPANTFVHQGATANLFVTATGGPPPAYHWMRNGASIPGSDSKLALPNFQSANEGTYSVIVSNSFGALPSSNAIVVLDTLHFRGPQVSGGGFQLHLSGAPGSKCVIETSTNLSDWIPLLTNSAASGFIDLSDTNTAFKWRFYRALTN